MSILLLNTGFQGSTLSHWAPELFLRSSVIYTSPGEAETQALSPFLSCSTRCPSLPGWRSITLCVDFMCWVSNHLLKSFFQKKKKKSGTVLFHGEWVVVLKCQSLGMLQTTWAAAGFVFACCAELRTQASVMDRAPCCCQTQRKGQNHSSMNLCGWESFPHLMWGTNLPAADRRGLRLMVLLLLFSDPFSHGYSQVHRRHSLELKVHGIFSPN